MSYQSIKRVLGETHLERKCRFLFGLCLLLLIAGSFSWVWLATESLVYEKYRRTGALLVDSIMLKTHWNVWVNVEDKETKELVHEMTVDLQDHQRYKHEFLSFKDGQVMRHVSGDQWEPVTQPKKATDSPEKEVKSDLDIQREILLSLKKAMKQRQEEEALAEAEKEKSSDQGDPTAPGDTTDPDASPPKSPSPIPEALLDGEDPELKTEDPPALFRDRWVKNKGEYHYYQPVDWTGWDRSCNMCHSLRSDIAALGAATSPSVIEEDRPFHVVKVIISDDETHQAINKNRAILIATAIITVFLAMVALYLIIRYVVVKPLKHLRDVSDEISRGNTALRADLHTGDEFEDLGASFNRMLRHLVDTQDELRDKTFDLDAKVDELAQVNMQLYEMNRLKSDFLANMSHELRTPLNSIIGFSEVLQGLKALDDKQKRYAANIQRSGRSLLEMINDILDLAKMESGKMQVRSTEFQIEHLIQAQYDMVHAMTEKKNIELSVESSPGLPPMFQDEGKVQQILTNLLSNAIKFTPEGGRITVATRRTGNEMLEMDVIDTGIGIAAEDREVIFEKFRQGSVVLGDDNLTREYSGTGLGLSIAKELSILLGGELTFESETGKGTRFTVTLPWVYRQRPEQLAEVDRQMQDMAHSTRWDFYTPESD